MPNHGLPSVALALAAISAGGTDRPAQAPTDLSVSLVRSYLPASSQTLVDIFCRVPMLLVSPIGASGAGAYRFAVSVQDSAGLELVSQSWRTPVRERLLRTGGEGASLVEHLRFSAGPGRLTIGVTATDSATGRVIRAATATAAFGGPPEASDLLLASEVREAAGSSDTTARGGEVRYGTLFFMTSGAPVLTPQSSKLVYYLELYPTRAERVQVSARVLTDAGAPVVASPPVPATVGAGGGVTTASMDLSRLPPGRYRLDVNVTGPDSHVSRSAPFGMTGFETSSRATALAASGDWPSSLNEAQLDSAYEPLIYLMSAEEQGEYSSLSVEGKRRWLRQFWARRDPSAGTARNEERERFYGAIAEADRRYREGGAWTIPGWRTDRGRIFIKYGPPGEVLEGHGQTAVAPYEIWKYTRNRISKYVFMDLTRFGNYRLIYTDDPREPSRPDWQELLGADGVKDLQQ